jgi:hypothetical protein
MLSSGQGCLTGTDRLDVIAAARQTSFQRRGSDVKMLQVLVGGIVMIGGIVMVAGIVIYVVWFLTLLAIRRVPMIGKRHRHRNWDRLNREAAPQTLEAPPR